MTVGLPLARQHGLLMIPNTLQNNMNVFALRTSLLYNGYNSMLTGSTPPGEIHSATLRNLPRIGGAYIIYHEETRAVLLCGMARFPVSGGNKPS